MRSRRTQDYSGIAILIGFFVLAGIVLSSSGQGEQQIVGTESYRNPSIENTRASGSAGLYQWTKRLGYKSEALTESFEHLPDTASLLVCIAPDNRSSPLADLAGNDDDAPDVVPSHELTADEGRALCKWLAGGRTLILLASSLPGGAGDKDSFSKEIGLQVESALGNTGTRRDFAPMQPVSWTSGVASIRIHEGQRDSDGYRLYRSRDDAVILFGDVITTPFKPGARPLPKPPPTLHMQAVAMEYPVGKGRVIAVADDVFACNANLRRADNALFLYRILSLSAPPGSRILFDEYHRGIEVAATGGVWDALGPGIRMACLQLLLVALVAVFVLAPRLGRPEPAVRPRARSTAEYVTSLAALYQSAGATRTALETIYRQLLRDMCQRLGQPSDISLSDLADIASRRAHVDAGALRKLFVACEQALEPKGTLSERDLMILVQRIERTRKEMGIV